MGTRRQFRESNEGPSDEVKMSLCSVSAENVGVAGSRIPLLHNHHTKTLDAGHNGHTVSCGAIGDVSFHSTIPSPFFFWVGHWGADAVSICQILQLSCYHPIHGMVVACPFSQFDSNRFYDSEYVRSYRNKVLEYIRTGTRGFGVNFEGQIRDLDVNFLPNGWILATYSINSVQLSTTVFLNEKGEVVQSTVLTSGSSGITHLDYTLDLTISVNRASYGQLTEGGPIPMPLSENDFQLLELGRWVIINQNLDAMIEGSFYINDRAVDLRSSLSDEVFHCKPANKAFHGRLQFHPGQTVTMTSSFKLHPGITPTSQLICPSAPPPSLKGGWKLPGNELGMIIRRNLAYILGNCTLPVGNGAVCFIADHVALPLGWNRDN